jgi:hypothetical protein
VELTRPAIGGAFLVKSGWDAKILLFTRLDGVTSQNSPFLQSAPLQPLASLYIAVVYPNCNAPSHTPQITLSAYRIESDFHLGSFYCSAYEGIRRHTPAFIIQ